MIFSTCGSDIRTERSVSLVAASPIVKVCSDALVVVVGSEEVAVVVLSGDASSVGAEQPATAATRPRAPSRRADRRVIGEGDIDTHDLTVADIGLGGRTVLYTLKPTLPSTTSDRNASVEICCCEDTPRLPSPSIHE